MTGGDLHESGRQAGDFLRVSVLKVSKKTPLSEIAGKATGAALSANVTLGNDF